MGVVNFQWLLFLLGLPFAFFGGWTLGRNGLVCVLCFIFSAILLLLSLRMSQGFLLQLGFCS